MLTILDCCGKGGKIIDHELRYIKLDAEGDWKGQSWSSWFNKRWSFSGKVEYRARKKKFSEGHDFTKEGQDFIQKRQNKIKGMTIWIQIIKVYCYIDEGF